MVLSAGGQWPGQVCARGADAEPAGGGCLQPEACQDAGRHVRGHGELLSRHMLHEVAHSELHASLLVAFWRGSLVDFSYLCWRVACSLSSLLGWLKDCLIGQAGCQSALALLLRVVMMDRT